MTPKRKPYTVRRLLKILRQVANEPDDCTLCGADTREQYDCRSCPADHMGGRCLRRGQHQDTCPLKEFESVTRVKTQIEKER